MVNARTLLWGSLIAGGVVAGTVGADVVGSDQLALGLAIGGFAVAWVAVLAGTRFEQIGRTEDERFEAIFYRAGFYGWLATVAVASTLSAALSQEPGLLSERYALVAVLAAAVGTFLAASTYLERAM